MFHKTEKFNNVIIFHSNTTVRWGLTNQKFFIRSMKINLPIFPVLVGLAGSRPLSVRIREVILSSPLSTVLRFVIPWHVFFFVFHFFWFFTNLVIDFKHSRWCLFRVISISNSIFGGGNRIGFLNISMIIHEICGLSFWWDNDGLFAWWKSFFAKGLDLSIEKILIFSRCFCYDWLCFVRSIRLRGDFMFCGLFFCESNRDVHSCKTRRLLPFFKIIV